MNGAAYQLNGFLNAVIRRSPRTCLVEGPTDKELLHRLLIARGASSDAVRIDEVSIVNDVALSGLGAKQKIQEIIRASANVPQAAAKLATLVDREWGGLMNGGRISMEWCELPKASDNEFSTRGHSIENYYLALDCILGYLEFAHAQIVTERLIMDLRSGFPEAIRLARSFSVTASERRVIKRCEDLVRIHHIILDNGAPSFGPSMRTDLDSRGVADSGAFLADVGALVRAEQVAGSDPLLHARWIAHGHLGMSIVWAWVGAAVKASGATPERANEVAFGSARERQRFCNDWLTRVPSVDRAPLDDVLLWLTQ